MRRSVLYTAMAGIMAITSTAETQAAMPAETILDFTGVFTMRVSPTLNIPTPIRSGPDGGILTGAGITQDTNGHNSHGGTKAHLQGGLDFEWTFFSNSGMHFTSSPVVVTNEDVNTDGGFTKELDFSGWRVTWNAIPSINMGGGFQDCGTSTDGICANLGPDIAGTYDNGSQLASITCTTADCPFGSDFTLTYNAVVPQDDPSGFGGVNYGVNVSGVIFDPTAPPIANNDTAATIVNNPVTIDVVANDQQNPDSTTLSPVTPTTQGGSAVAIVTDSGGVGYKEVEYTPPAGFANDTDTFTYTVSNPAGTSVPATVTVDVNDNVSPFANNDLLSTNTAVLTNAIGINGGIDIAVLANDTDANNPTGLPGGINPTTVLITLDAVTGDCSVNPDGSIKYSQPLPTVTVDAATEFCKYTVKDIDTDAGGAGPLLSNEATVGITVSEINSDWPTVLPDPNTIPILLYEAGVPAANTTTLPLSGSFFGMQLSANPPDNIVYTTLTPGPSGGLVIGYEQPTGVSHGSGPNGFEETGFDLGWDFFGNTGFTRTANGGIKGNGSFDGVPDPAGTLRFGSDLTGDQGRYIITWNAIPAIDLGGDKANFQEDLGFATINCDTKQPVDPGNTATCADESYFELNYAAHVPIGDPSNFGGVPYTLFLKGVVGFLDGNFIVSGGANVDSQSRLTAAGTGVVDPDVIVQCAGGCIDYSISGVAPGTQVKLVVPLAGGVPLNPVWRILDAGIWRSFDTSQGDTIKSALWAPGDGACPAPGDPAYRTDVNGKPVTGDLCIELTITDNTGANSAAAPNDLDATGGVVADASGLGSGGTAGGGAPPPIVIKPGSTSGCSLSTTSIKPQLRIEWWLLGGFMAWLGWRRRKQQQ